MIRALDRFAASVAARLIAWLATRVDASRKEWIDAMSGELDAIDGGWRKLTWAISGLPLAWTFGRAPMPAKHVPLTSSRHLRAVFTTERNSWVHAIAFNALTFTGWAILTVLCAPAMPSGGGRVYGLFGITLLCTLGVAVTLALRARGAAYMLASGAVFYAMRLAGEMSFARFGWRMLVGWPGLADNVAGLGAAFLAVTLAAVIERRTVRRHGIAVPVAAALLVFALTEAAVRIIAGLHPFVLQASDPTGRLVTVDHSAVSNYAIALCAVGGTILGGLIGHYGDRLTMQRRRA